MFKDTDCTQHYITHMKKVFGHMDVIPHVDDLLRQHNYIEDFMKTEYEKETMHASMQDIVIPTYYEDPIVLWDDEMAIHEPIVWADENKTDDVLEDILAQGRDLIERYRG